MSQHPASLKGLLLKLVGYQRAEFSIASRQQGWVLRMQALAALVAIVAAFVKNEDWLYVLGIIALIAVLASQFFQWRARVTRNVAEEMRRTLLVHYGLGIQISVSDFADLTGRAASSPNAAVGMEDPSWYATAQPAGYARLTEMLEESAHFSQMLLAHSARWTWIRFSILLAATFIILLIAIRFGGVSTLLRNVQIACAGFTFLLSGEVFGAALRYTQAAADVRLVTSGLQRARTAGFPSADVTLLMANYNSAVEAAPLFVPGLHAKIKDVLNTLFGARHQGSAAP